MSNLIDLGGEKVTLKMGFCVQVVWATSTSIFRPIQPLSPFLSLSFASCKLFFYSSCCMCSWAVAPLSFALQSAINYLSACIIHSTSLLYTEEALQSLPRYFQKPFPKSPSLSLLLTLSFAPFTKSWPILLCSILCQNPFFFLSTPESLFSISPTLAFSSSSVFHMYLALY